MTAFQEGLAEGDFAPGQILCHEALERRGPQRSQDFPGALALAYLDVLEYIYGEYA